MSTLQSSPRDKLKDNGGFADFKLLLVIQNARDMAQILRRRSNKVCSTPSSNLVIIESSLKSAIFSQRLTVTLWRHQMLVYRIFNLKATR